MTPAAHVIFTNGRSGSNFLVDALNQHPQLCNYGEVLGFYMPSMKLHERFGYGGKTVEAYLDFILSSRRHFETAQLYSAVSRLRRGQSPRRKRWSEVTSIGVKDFAIRFAERGVEHYLESRPETKVVSLNRENTFRRAVSITSLRRTGVVAVNTSLNSATDTPAEDSSRPPRQFEVDVGDFLDLMQTLESEKEQQLAMVDALDPQRCLRLTYEQMFASPEDGQRLVGEVCTFLGVEPRVFEVNHRQIVPADIRETILNYDTLQETLVEAGFSSYLPTS